MFFASNCVTAWRDVSLIHFHVFFGFRFYYNYNMPRWATLGEADFECDALLSLACYIDMLMRYFSPGRTDNCYSCRYSSALTCPGLSALYSLHCTVSRVGDSQVETALIPCFVSWITPHHITYHHQHNTVFFTRLPFKCGQ